MEDLKEAKGRLHDFYRKRFLRMRFVSRMVRIVFLLLGTFGLTISTIFLSGVTWPPGPLAVSAVFFAFLLLIGGLFSLDSEGGASQSIEDARRVIDSYDELRFLYMKSTESLKSLYMILTLSRGMIEQLASLPERDEEKSVRLLLDILRHEIWISMDFEYRQMFSITVYKAIFDAENKRHVLQPIAISRSTETALDMCRHWPEGVGATGSAFANDNEVRIPDMSDPKWQSAYPVPHQMAKDRDSINDLSLFAVPISVSFDGRSWGVVTASCSDPDHFSHEKEGVDPGEAVRALAGQIALMITVCRSSLQNQISEPSGNAIEEPDTNPGS